MSAKVADVMTRKVIAVRGNASFREIAVKLRDERVSAFPVLDDDGRVIGVVSEADLLAKEAADGGHEAVPGRRPGPSHDDSPGAAARHRRRPHDDAAGHHCARRTRQPAPLALCTTAGVKRLPVVTAKTVSWSGSSAGPTC